MYDELNNTNNGQRGVPISNIMEMSPKEIENQFPEQGQKGSKTENSTKHTKEHKSGDKKRSRCADLLTTKSEAFTIFFIILVAMCVFTLTLQKSIVDHSNELSAQISDLNSQIAVLKMQIESLESKLDVYESENNKPVDITINLDGLSLKYDQESGTLAPEGTSEPDVDPNFDTRPFLGVGFNDVDDSANNPIGMQIDYVYQYSPAEKAGMKGGDIIMAINGTKINTFDDLDAIMNKLSANEKIEIQLATASDTGVNVVTVETTLTYRGNYDLDDKE